MTQDMPEPGTMEALHEQVQAFSRGALEREGVVTGWVLMVASTRFTDEGDVAHAYNYSVGLDTPLTTAVGLVELGRRLMYRDIGPHDEHKG